MHSFLHYQNRCQNYQRSMFFKVMEPPLTHHNHSMFMFLFDLTFGVTLFVSLDMCTLLYIIIVVPQSIFNPVKILCTLLIPFLTLSCWQLWMFLLPSQHCFSRYYTVGFMQCILFIEFFLNLILCFKIFPCLLMAC